MGIEKLKNFITGDGAEVEEEKQGDDKYYTASKSEATSQSGLSGNKVMLLEPRAYS